MSDQEIDDAWNELRVKIAVAKNNAERRRDIWMFVFVAAIVATAILSAM